MFNYLFPKNCVHYEIIWKNVVESHRPQINKRGSRKDAICMSDKQGKNTDTHS